MSWINDLLEKPLRKRLTDPHFKPAVLAAEAAKHDGATTAEVLEAALTATRDTYVREGRPLDAKDIRVDAFKATGAAAMEKPFQAGDLPTGTDKAQHFFVSGEIAGRIENALSWLPFGLSVPIARGLTKSVGFMKEVIDLTTSGFSREDLKADYAGIEFALIP